MSDLKAMNDRPSLWVRMMLRAFPPKHVTRAMGTEATRWGDQIRVNIVTHFSIVDRIRILFGGRVCCDARVSTENPVGNAVTVAAAWPTCKALTPHVAVPPNAADAAGGSRG